MSTRLLTSKAKANTLSALALTPDHVQAVVTSSALAWHSLVLHLPLCKLVSCPGLLLDPTHV